MALSLNFPHDLEHVAVPDLTVHLLLDPRVCIFELHIVVVANAPDLQGDLQDDKWGGFFELLPSTTDVR